MAVGLGTDVGAGAAIGEGAAVGLGTRVGTAVGERVGMGVSASPPHARAITRVKAKTKNIPAEKLELIRLHVPLIGNLLE